MNSKGSHNNDEHDYDHESKKLKLNKKKEKQMSKKWIRDIEFDDEEDENRLINDD